MSILPKHSTSTSSSNTCMLCISSNAILNLNSEQNNTVTNCGMNGDEKLLKILSLHKIRQNMGFLWSLFSCIGAESAILFSYGKIQARSNPYSGIFCPV